jgi:hypothetical protein
LNPTLRLLFERLPKLRRALLTIIPLVFALDIAVVSATEETKQSIFGFADGSAVTLSPESANRCCYKEFRRSDGRGFAQIAQQHG